MEFAAIHSLPAAFVAGLVTSLHCAGMCGPLACSLLPVRGDRADASTVATIYHAARLGGYAVLGALAGGLGRAPLTWLTGPALRVLPWAMVLVFIALAFRWDRHLPKVPLLGRMTFRIQNSLRGKPRWLGAGLVGLMTPLLPCGPLYFIVTLALLSGSALRGVETMLAFGLGTVPLLWLAQTQFHWVRQKLSPLWLDRTRLALALMTAGVLAWRLRGSFGFAGPDWDSLICF